MSRHAKLVLTTEDVVTILLVTAKAASRNTSATHPAHPEDLGYTMTFAIDVTAQALAEMRRLGHLEWVQ